MLWIDSHFDVRALVDGVPHFETLSASLVVSFDCHRTVLRSVGVLGHAYEALDLRRSLFFLHEVVVQVRHVFVLRHHWRGLPTLERIDHPASAPEVGGASERAEVLVLPSSICSISRPVFHFWSILWSWVSLLPGDPVVHVRAHSFACLVAEGAALGGAADRAHQLLAVLRVHAEEREGEGTHRGARHVRRGHFPRDAHAVRQRLVRLLTHRVPQVHQPRSAPLGLVRRDPVRLPVRRAHLLHDLRAETAEAPV